MDELLQKYGNLWQLSEASLIVETNTSHVYKVAYQGKCAVLKVYTEIGRIDEADGASFLKNCKGHGVVDVYELDNTACLLQYIDGEEVLSLVNQNKDKEATQIIAQTLKKIHNVPIPSHFAYQSLEQRMRCLFEYSDLDDTPALINRAANFARKILKNKDDVTMLHGDMHHENVMHDSQTGWVAIDPKGIIGDRAYDCANTLFNPIKRPDLTQDLRRLLKQADLMGAEMDIHPQRIINYAYIHGALSSCWTKDDNGHYGMDAIKTSALLEPYIK